MLQLLLTILKILGIIVLVILGIILAVLLVVLFVPLRYRGDVSFDGKPKGGVLVSWLLRIITVRVEYDGSAAKALVKILWFRLFEKKLWPSEEEDAAEALTGELADDGFFAENIDIPVNESGKTAPEKCMTEPKLPESVNQKTAESQPVNESPKKTQPVQTETVKAKASVSSNPEPKISSFEAKKEEHTSEPEVTEKPPLLETVFSKVQSAISKIYEKVQTTRTNVSAKYEASQSKIEMVRTFLGDTENQNMIRLIWRQVIRLLKHILPRKMTGRVKFGFDDPATTGQILTYISPFYGIYAKSVSIEPVFDEKVMEGELHLKGHIRVAALLWIVIRIILNKNFRTLVKKFLKSRK